MNMIQENGRGLQSLMADHDIKQLALLFLNLNDTDIKSTIQILQEVLSVIANDQVVGIQNRLDFSHLKKNPISRMIFR